jgi:hypothetical protein
MKKPWGFNLFFYGSLLYFSTYLPTILLLNMYDYFIHIRYFCTFDYTLNADIVEYIPLCIPNHGIYMNSIISLVPVGLWSFHLQNSKLAQICC